MSCETVVLWELFRSRTTLWVVSLPVVDSRRSRNWTYRYFRQNCVIYMVEFLDIIKKMILNLVKQLSNIRAADHHFWASDFESTYSSRFSIFGRQLAKEQQCRANCTLISNWNLRLTHFTATWCGLSGGGRWRVRGPASTGSTSPEARLTASCSQRSCSGSSHRPPYHPLSHPHPTPD